MSFQAMKWAHEQEFPDSESKLLMLVLANYAGHDNTCWPSIGRLARECVLSIRTVQYKIRQLQKLGFIKVLYRKNERNNTSNLYTLLIPPPGAAPAPPWCTPCTTPGAGPAPKPITENLSMNRGNPLLQQMLRDNERHKPKRVR